MNKKHCKNRDTEVKLDKRKMKTGGGKDLNGIFQVQGKSYFSIGGQTHNSSSYSEKEMEKAWAAAKELGLNTIASPVWWRLLEPEEGVYDYRQADMLLRGAREHGLKLVLLWFGSWKNGASHYIPNWMKGQKERFAWVETVQHNTTMILSPHCRASMEADKRAFAKLMGHLKEMHAEDVLLGVQIENEPGLLGSPRDYSGLGESVYKSPVPAELIRWLGETGDCCEKRLWMECGAKTDGNWEEVFGFYGPELCTAYNLASYVNAVSAAGKKQFQIPTYINVWLGEMYNRVTGVDYPSGGAVGRVLHLWKHLTPDIDAICPDVYFMDSRTYDKVCSEYAIEGNPLYIPESGADEFNAVNTMRGIAEFGLTGIHCFGIESYITNEGKLCEGAVEYRNMTRILAGMKPLIEEYHGTGKLYPVAQYEGSEYEYFDFGDFYGRAIYYKGIGIQNLEERNHWTDHWHEEERVFQVRGKGIILYKGGGEFYIGGEGFRLNLIRRDTIEGMSSGVRASSFQNGRHQRYLAVEEGHFNDRNEFVTDRIRTGDECDTGLWMDSDFGILHVCLEL